ncbi:hypothetical protein LP316_15265 [Thalassotalea sp. LPB0316]|uniref:hypothetical protein n=1 Tax=Thalassotalea sp. LPB0316 TaxID=2769490 RepID=UPI0018675674|nr:hypothetical protein [Thalassotalea sp. LPB0316]QOL25630.1 hypothetical protein LP316_15265 [Thalassotalea sp. LPB0316]
MVIKKLMVLLAASLIALNTNAIAEEMPVTDNLPADIGDIVKVCHQDSVEDEVEADSLNDYLVMCINDELEANEFDPLSYESALKLIKQHTPPAN